jgi:diacylglycerol kinase (ATP)
VFTTCPGDARELGRQAAQDFDALVAVGGDGTAAEVTEGLLQAAAPRAALGLVPLGTGNDLAEALGMGTVAGAVRSLTGGQVKPIDVIEVRCQAQGRESVRHALLFAGVGIISEALKRTTPQLKRLFGPRLAYPAGLVHALASYQAQELEVTCDGEVLRQRCLFAGASNTPIAGGGLKIAPGARIDDGWLNVNLIGAMGRWRALRHLRRLSYGRHIDLPAVRYRPARRLVLGSPAGLEVAADGELVGHTPAEIRVLPGALRVLMPPGKAKLEDQPAPN